jgi:uncharacterized phage protein (TIGR02216 family)
MNESFGACAAQLCGAASAVLGWRPAEFWEATPAELAMALNFASSLGEPLSAEAIDALRQRFPDNRESE